MESRMNISSIIINTMTSKLEKGLYNVQDYCKPKVSFTKKISDRSPTADTQLLKASVQFSNKIT